jgi:antitoxin HigA-1
MKMYNPPHPGEIIKGLWLDPMDISITQAAVAMGISRKTLSKIVSGNGRITPETAVRLSVTLGSSPESWLGHQAAYDLWQVEQYRTKLNAVSLLPSATLATS